MLTLGQAINSATGVTHCLLNTTGHERDTLKGVMFGGVTHVVLGLVLIPLPDCSEQQSRRAAPSQSKTCGWPASCGTGSAWTARFLGGFAMNAQPAMFATPESEAHSRSSCPPFTGVVRSACCSTSQAEFVRLNHQVDLVLMNACHTPLMDLVPDGIRVVDLGCPRLWNSTPAMTRYLRTEQPDAVLAAMPLANAIAAYARAPRPAVPVRLVLSEHNAKSIAFGDIESLRDRGCALLLRSRIDSPIASSLTWRVADRLLSVPGVRKSRVQVVYNCLGGTPSSGSQWSQCLIHGLCRSVGARRDW